MIANHLKFLFKISKNPLIFSHKKKYSQVYGNIVKLSEDLNIKEIKIPCFDETSVIYYKDEDKLESLIPKIKAANDKIQ